MNKCRSIAIAIIGGVHTLLPFLLLVYLAMSFSGCCGLVGYAIGARIDSGPEYSAADDKPLKTSKAGRKAIVRLTDGSVVKGEFKGVAETDSIDYFQRYRQVWRDSVLPSIGDKIVFKYDRESDRKLTRTNDGEAASFTYKPGATVRGIFTGFDQDYPRLPWSTYIYLETDESGEVFTERLSLASYLYSPSGDSINTGDIGQLISQNIVPLRSIVEIQSDSSAFQIPLERVADIQFKNRRNARYVGLGIGLAIDAATWIIAIADGFDVAPDMGR